MKLDKPQLRDTFEVFSEFARIHLINIQGNLEGTLGAQQNSPSFFFLQCFMVDFVSIKKHENDFGISVSSSTSTRKLDI